MRERQRPLLERVKEIFKKYGWTLQAVVLAVGVVFSALALAGLNGLKAGTKAVGKGLKTIGQKLGSLLPGLIGSIVSFIFKAAGQVLSFLGEHAWLLILAVVAFFRKGCSRRGIHNKAHHSKNTHCYKCFVYVMRVNGLGGLWLCGYCLCWCCWCCCWCCCWWCCIYGLWFWR